MKFEECKKSTPRFPKVAATRLTEAEYASVKFKAEATGQTISQYIRKRAIGGRVSKPKADREDINFLRKITGLMKKLSNEGHQVRHLIQDCQNAIRRIAGKDGDE